ncbi:MAG: glycerophosphodiester phosphodiesterase family protein [Ignavibacteriales bacterium]
MDWLLKIPISHRGLHDNISVPENSLAAFKASMAEGYPIELDVRLLADGHLAVFHDLYLSRMTSQKGSVLKKNSREVRRMRLLDTNETIPLLSEVLELVNGRVPLLIEVKNRKQVGILESRLLHMLKGYKGEYAIESFNPLSVKWFRNYAPQIIRGQLSGAFGSIRSAGRRALLRGYFFSRLSRPDFIAYDIKYLPARRVNNFRLRGIPVIGYTAKSRREFELAGKYCDNVIFEGFLP